MAMQRALLNALMSSGPSRGEEICSAEVYQRVISDVPKLLADGHRTISISEVDLCKTIVRNRDPSKTPREPFMSKEEVEAAQAALTKARKAYEELVAQLEVLDRVKTKCALRQAERQAAKLASHHCKHCEGKKGPCACREDCTRRDHVQCVDTRHCKHCDGEGRCTCRHECVRKTGNTCAKPSAPKKTTTPTKKKVKEKDEECCEDRTCALHEDMPAQEDDG